MSPKAGSSKPKPVPQWKRAEAGVYQSSDERFSIRSEGPSRWFITDEEQHDEFGLARTVGPFDTLDAAKDAADALRGEAPAASPLAGRLAKVEKPAKPRAPRRRPTRLHRRSRHRHHREPGSTSSRTTTETPRAPPDG